MKQLALLVLSTLMANAALAQSLDAFYPRKEVAGRVVQKGSVPLIPEQSDSYLRVFVYRPTDVAVPPGTGTYDGLPVCAQSRIRRTPVLVNTRELQEFDMTFYDYKDRTQLETAKKSRTPTVPYLEGDMYNPKRDAQNLQQSFARFFDVRCLPTRVHFVEAGGRKFEEYREGKSAWNLSAD